MQIKKVGVVGCGTMGNGIAQVCAQSGYQVVVSEVDQAFLDRGLGRINSFLARSLEKGKITPQDKEATLTRIKGTTDIRDFAGCDLVIEAATENMAIKKKIFADLDRITPKGAILATNTSCLSIIDLALVTGRPDKVLGLHFFGPAQLMKLLEIIHTLATSAETLETGKEFGRSVGKTIVIARDTPGFIANYLNIPGLLLAMRAYDAGLATKEDIDTTMSLGYNRPMGPLDLSDAIGLDVVLFIADAIYEATREPAFAAPPILRKMVTANWLGRKTGRGFYEYK